MTTAQLDLFGEVGAALDLRNVFRALRDDRWDALLRDCCTGGRLELGRHAGGERCADGSEGWRQTRCGRCGNMAPLRAESLGGDHDGRWMGCPLPVEQMDWSASWWVRRPDDRHAPGTDRAAWLLTRHDRRHHADCTCGHPWGWHDADTAGMWLRPRGRCWEYCGCEVYTAGPVAPAQPSRWGTSWTPSVELLERLPERQCAA